MYRGYGEEDFIWWIDLKTNRIWWKFEQTSSKINSWYNLKTKVLRNIKTSNCKDIIIFLYFYILYFKFHYNILLNLHKYIFSNYNLIL